MACGVPQQLGAEQGAIAQVEEAHMMEFQQFNAIWDKKVRDDGTTRCTAGRGYA